MLTAFLHSALAGLLCAAAARLQLAEGRSPYGAELRAVLAFGAIVLWPAIAYLHLAHPAWAWLYRFDVEPPAFAALVAALLASAALLVGGYLAGARLAGRRGPRAVLLACAAGGLVLAASIHVTGERLGVHGTRAEYAAGEATPIGETRLPWMLGLLIVGVDVSLALVLLHLRALRRPASRSGSRSADPIPPPEPSPTRSLRDGGA